jgi:hypothetical protein
MRRDSFSYRVSQGMKNSSTITETTQPSSKRTMDRYTCSTGVLTMRCFFQVFLVEKSMLGQHNAQILFMYLTKKIVKKFFSFLSACTFIFCVNWRLIEDLSTWYRNNTISNTLAQSSLKPFRPTAGWVPLAAILILPRLRFMHFCLVYFIRFLVAIFKNGR